MPKIPPSRTRKSKQEVEREFSKISEEVDRERTAASAKADELARAREAEIRQASQGITVDLVVQKMAGLGLEVSKALSDLSGKLTAEVERLNDIRESVALESRELERLHKIDIAATALDQLVQEYRLKKEELETEISSTREAWASEEEERAFKQKEFEDALKKQRQREAEEYEYKKALERKKAQDKYEEEMRLLEKQNREKQEALEKSWQQREAALKEREEELARLRAEVEAFPARLKKEIEAAVRDSVRAAEQRYEQQMVLLKKDAESEKRLAELQIKSLQETVARQSTEIESLQRQVEDAKRQVQDIAVKAIEGASGAKALAHVNKIAMEQAKTRAPQG
ncbi:MAG: hypothetical protein HXY20_09740 [Acidobacteria bacterium]|nr:hypothetical protein [Acidobacteriota bacterium]